MKESNSHSLEYTTQKSSFLEFDDILVNIDFINGSDAAQLRHCYKLWWNLPHIQVAVVIRTYNEVHICMKSSSFEALFFLSNN